VTITARRRVRRKAEQLRDRLEGEAFPEFQMHDGALLRRHLRERRGHLLAKGALVARRGFFKERCLGGETRLVARPRLVAAKEIERGVMREPQQKRPLVAHALEQLRPARELHEDLLE